MSDLLEQRQEAEREQQRQKRLAAIERGFLEFAEDYGDKLRDFIEQKASPELKERYRWYRDQALADLD